MKKYDHKSIEKKWQKQWLKDRTYEPSFEPAKKSLDPARGKPFYNLMMFPYPSAEGLHVGNVYAFTGSDIYGRYKRMQGYDVFEPIGLDGFGIHSENYALKIGQHPADQAKISEKNFYRQLGLIGNGFAWKERLETYDLEYYKWTQWIFIQLFKAGLAYRKKSPVNWCPSCLTVLADEQVISGECERCGTKVIKKELEQWFFKITDYAERLLTGLDKIDWSEKVKIAQRNWIGRSEGTLIKFEIRNTKYETNSKPQISRQYLKVFTTRPDTIFGATYMVLAPEHELVSKIRDKISNIKEIEDYIKSARNKSEADRISAGKEKTGVELRGVKAINPANNEEIPIWIADYVLAGYGTGAIMAVPAHDERDLEFAQKYNLPVSNAPLASIEEAIKKSGGERKTQYRLRDWLISRQRYWGPPIPMVHCPKCGWQPVLEKDLPVALPHVKDFRPTGTDKSPLAADEKFYKTKCPKCGGDARRETDVSDTFLDSAWYYIGYLMQNQKSETRNPKQTPNPKFQFPKAILKKWLPVNMYIGGAEHSVLHLLYVRFISMAMHDMGILNFPARGGSAFGRDEPFPIFRAHGLIIKDGAKMSKSKGNIVNPDEYIEKYGADVLRMYLMFIGPFDQGGDFRDSGIKGITRFLDRVWKISNSQFLISKQNPKSKIQISKLVHKTIKKVTEDIENLQYNTAISALMVLLNYFEDNRDSVSREDFGTFLKLLAPFAPHMAEEIYQTLIYADQNADKRGKFRSIHVSDWPEYNPKLIKETEVEVVVQVNGKTRGVIKIKAGLIQKDVETAARADRNVSKHLDAVKKIIFVKDKLINFVS